MFDNRATILNTNTSISADVEVDDFRSQKSFIAYVANTKITFRWNGKTYVGNLHGMEFTSSGPAEIKKLKGRF